jgi:hypothetical protein
MSVEECKFCRSITTIIDSADETLWCVGCGSLRIAGAWEQPLNGKEFHSECQNVPPDLTITIISPGWKQYVQLDESHHGLDTLRRQTFCGLEEDSLRDQGFVLSRDVQRDKITCTRCQVS